MLVLHTKIILTSNRFISEVILTNNHEGKYVLEDEKGPPAKILDIVKEEDSYNVIQNLHIHKQIDQVSQQNKRKQKIFT